MLSGPVLGSVYFAGSIATTALAKRMTTRRAASVIPRAKVEEDVLYFGINPKKPDEFRGKDAMNPPVPRKDTFNWLRDETRKKKDVLDYLHKENSYCGIKMEHLNSLETTLYDEMVSHMKETDEEVPYIHGEYLYYSRTEKGKSYRIHCRKPCIADGGRLVKETVILDENKIATGHEYSDIGSIAVSPSHNLLAYTVDNSGYETYSLRIISNIETGEELEDVIEEVDGDIIWGNDDSSLFYSKMDEEHRPFKLFLHVLGTPQEEDVCVYTEDDTMFWLHATKTADEKFLMVGGSSKETSEQHVLRLQNVFGGEAHRRAVAAIGTSPFASFQCIQKRSFGVRFEEAAEHHNGYFYIITNADGSKNNKLVRCPVDAYYPSIHAITTPDINATDRAPQWTDAKAYDPEQQIDELLPFKNHIVMLGRAAGIPKLWIAEAIHRGDLLFSEVVAPTLVWKEVEFPESMYSTWIGANYEFDSPVVRIGYSSFLTPKRVIELNMNNFSSNVLKEQEVPGYNKSQYECVRMYAPSHDGKRQIPMSVVYKKTSEPLALRPTLLYGYGSYGACIDPSFDFKRSSLLDRGVVYVIGHIRGGGELGKAWYEDEGKYLTKRNTFDDFAACAMQLIKDGVTSRDRLACVGRSAGGLLIGAMLNMYPHLFKAAVADVPFVDVLNTMSDPTIPLTVTEWEEWGNPNEEKYFEYMLSYSPYDNVQQLEKGAEFPAVLVTAGLNDPRVPFWEPAKLVAKLRASRHPDDQTPLLLKTDLSSGHFSASDRYKYIRETAFEYAFILDQIGAKTLM